MVCQKMIIFGLTIHLMISIKLLLLLLGNFNFHEEIIEEIQLILKDALCILMYM